MVRHGSRKGGRVGGTSRGVPEQVICSNFAIVLPLSPGGESKNRCGQSSRCDADCDFADPAI